MDILTVTDSSDWPPTMPELRTIDTLLRCPICYEFMKTAMMIPECSHNFCSLCIRTYMAYKNQCPTCSVSILETNLKNNRVLDDVIKNFLAVRPQILQMCKDKVNKTAVSGTACATLSPTSAGSEQTQVKQTSLSASSSGRASSQKIQDSMTPVCLNTRLNKSTKRPRRSPKSSSDIDDPDFEPCTKSPRVRSNQTPKRTNKRTRVKALTSSSEEDEVVAPTPYTSKHVGESPLAFSIPSPITPTTASNNNTRASCPVCGVSLLERFINTHLDRCLASEQKKDSLRSKRRPLLKFVSNLMTDKQLRNKLKEYNVSHQGPRQVLMKRLKDFALLYNSYCDTDNPKSVEAISKEFENMQKMKLKHASDSVKDRLILEKGDTDEKFNQSRKKYLSSHKSQFDKMIEETKRRQQEVRANASTSTAPSTQSTPPCSSIESLEVGANRQSTTPCSLIESLEVGANRQSMTPCSSIESLEVGANRQSTTPIDSSIDSQDKLAKEQDVTDTLTTHDSCMEDFFQVPRSEIIATESASEVTQDNGRGTNVVLVSETQSEVSQDDNGSDNNAILVSESHSEVSQDDNGRDSKATSVSESRSEVSKDDTDEPHSKSLSSPKATVGNHCIPESPVFHATVNRRLGKKRKDIYGCSSGDREEIRRSKRNKPDSQ